MVGPRTSAVIEVDDPEPAADQVLVEVVASGVCTSDLGVWRAGRDEPVLLGHEIVGRVVATGRDARRWPIGMLVTGLGDRGFAEKALLRSSRIAPVPPGIKPEHGIGEPVADLHEAVSRVPVLTGQRVAVVGLGFMGLGLVQLVKLQAPAHLVGVDPIPQARERARLLGADEVIGPDADPGQVDVVIEATGVRSGLRASAALVRPFGTLCVVGYHHTEEPVLDMDLWYKAVTIVNGFCPDQTRLMAAMHKSLRLVAERRFSYEPLVTHRFGLDEVDRAYRLMDERADGFVKAVLMP